MDAQAAKYLAAGIAILSGMGNAIGEGLICAHVADGISRNPEAYSKLRTTMILGCALTETTGIYALLIAIFVLFL